MTYDDMFREATGGADPYPYQRALAIADPLPEVLVAPTGAGKTGAVALAWLYRRRFASDSVRARTPRRLVMCLPMRTLVGQAAEAIRGWLQRLSILEVGHGLDRGAGVGVHVLMGGAFPDEWHLSPEEDAILVGTQDMLLSRALNRGYGMSRFLWPWHFAMLTNDCMWAFDEVQLMGVGLATGLQLVGFKKILGTYGPGHALFLSATLDPRWLSTADHSQAGETMTLGESDLETPGLQRRRQAVKRLERAATVLTKDSAKALAAEVRDRHVVGTRTIVVLNTVDRALGMAKAMRSLRGPETVLLHSRFRPGERQAALTRATATDFDGIVVSTQVIEAGIDLSSRTLFTEIAPWASVVQRAGRCNRAGEFPEASVIWIDHAALEPPGDAAGVAEAEKMALPYELEDLAQARAALSRLTSFNPEAIEAAGVVLRAPQPTHVLRRRDLVDLFDTTPDLAGVDLDVARFIRDGDERDCQVFWRPVSEKPPVDEPKPQRDEVCNVPFLELRKWVKKGHRVWRWSPVDGEWQVPLREEQILPGITFLVDSAAGGYTSEEGWNPDSKEPVTVIQPPAAAAPEEALGDDDLSFLDRWVPLRRHSLDARDAAREIVDSLGLDGLPSDVVVRAAQAHDLGKVHPVFQETMRAGHPGDGGGSIWAKSGRRTRHSRRGFRHELASALAWLQEGTGDEQDLVAYLLATHHGKVRLSIRSLPRDERPGEPDRLHARGVFDGDVLPECDLGHEQPFPETTLSLAPMRLGDTDGRPSWATRAVALRDRLGPFRLAFLEMLVRAADVRASMREQKP